MRGVHTFINDIRRQVFTEVARLAFEGGDYAKAIEHLPYKIIPGEVARHRQNIFLERAIVSERLRLAIGLPLREIDEYAPTGANIEESAIAEKYYEPPLINIINFACNACPPKQVRVTNMCQGCLAHPCMEVCPKDAISLVQGKSFIDQTKCIKCGKCADACPYGAILKLERPCAEACGMDAIGSDELGRAKIDYDKCVSCGMCLVNCPFGAISDKSQIFQLIQAIKRGDKVVAAVAPAFVSQFGDKVTSSQMREAMRRVGFDKVIEVAVGADMCTAEEAEDFLKKVPAEQPFMATSCCPAWSVMAKKFFPQFAPYISMALTPMVLTARLYKKDHPDARVVFIGPCAAKKLEASRRTIRSDVDFVLTFEEMQGIFDAKGIVPADMPINPDDEFSTGTAAGRGFAVTGGVAAAVKAAIKEIDPDREVLVEHADGLRECRKMLLMAKTGKYNGYLLEGMGCPGGCVAGAGTITPVKKSTATVTKYTNDAPVKSVSDSAAVKRLHEVQE
ncbi:4Fe-4S dicluster domain-containing protein [Flintibacter sp.]|uniref:4Fe-4S dicluster domain-containing protein n=1 Tax=Flintibacter sp. TaxID=1918624 RepID=UPI003A3FE1EA